MGRGVEEEGGRRKQKTGEGRGRGWGGPGNDTPLSPQNTSSPISRSKVLAFSASKNPGFFTLMWGEGRTALSAELAVRMLHNPTCCQCFYITLLLPIKQTITPSGKHTSIKLCAITGVIIAFPGDESPLEWSSDS